MLLPISQAQKPALNSKAQHKCRAVECSIWIFLFSACLAALCGCNCGSWMGFLRTFDRRGFLGDDLFGLRRYSDLEIYFRRLGCCLKGAGRVLTRWRKKDDLKVAVTLKDVAERAGVSALLCRERIPKALLFPRRLARKIEKAAEEMGYSPNALASSLTTGRTKMIGLVSNNFQNPVFLQVFDLFTSRIAGAWPSPPSR